MKKKLISSSFPISSLTDEYFFSFGARAMPPRVINRNACNFDCICKRKVGYVFFSIIFFFSAGLFWSSRHRALTVNGGTFWWMPKPTLGIHMKRRHARKPLTVLYPQPTSKQECICVPFKKQQALFCSRAVVTGMSLELIERMMA